MAIDEWENFLNPDKLRETLISMSIYIAAFEILKKSIVGRIRSFYVLGVGTESAADIAEYQQEVLSLARSPVVASLLWLKSNGGIENSDIETYDALRERRNIVAHCLHELVDGGLAANSATEFLKLVVLLRKIEVWWIVNVEIPANPDFDGQEIDQSGIVPGPVLAVQLLVDIALGNKNYLSARESMKSIERQRSTTSL